MNNINCDTLDASASLFVKGGWEQWLGGMAAFLSPVAASGDVASPGWKWPLPFVSPQWIEVLFGRGLSHSNDGVQKFVLWRILSADQAVNWLSEEFILREVLPRLSHSIEMSGVLKGQQWLSNGPVHKV